MEEFLNGFVRNKLDSFNFMKPPPLRARSLLYLFFLIQHLKNSRKELYLLIN